MMPEFKGIERRLNELSERLARLHPLRNKPLDEFLQDPYLRDIVERNLDWGLVYRHLQQIDDLARFEELVRQWLNQRGQKP